MKITGSYYFELTATSIATFSAHSTGPGICKIGAGLQAANFSENGGFNGTDTNGGAVLFNTGSDNTTSIGALSTSLYGCLGCVPTNPVIAVAMQFTANPVDSATMSNFFFTPTPAFVDFSIAANRRLFATAGGCTVNLGTQGATPLGFRPAVFLSATSAGFPDTFATNNGSGGTFALSSGDLTAAGTSPCCSPNTGPGSLTPGTSPAEPLIVNLDWSDNRGVSYGSPMQQSLGQPGAYKTVLQWRRLGLARDRVYRLSWSANTFVALQGAFLEEPIKSKS